MSPEAIGARLHTVDTLWQLSVKLADLSKSKDEPPSETRQSRAAEIVNGIRDVLYRDWDPLGVKGYPSTLDEYDAYIAPVYRVLLGSRLENELIETLRRIEREEMGIDSNSVERLHRVAKKLLILSVTLD